MNLALELHLQKVTFLMYIFLFFILVNFVIITSETLRLPVLCWFFVPIVKHTFNKYLDSLVCAV